MILRKIFTLVLLLATSTAVLAHLPANYKKKKVNKLISLRNDCAPATQATDMNINNVRARLRIGGDLWWDGQGVGRYVVPTPAPGFPEVSAIFAGGVWLGGVDPAGNLKAAITQYPSGNVTDFWPGPLDENGETSASQCAEWDRFFEIQGDNVRKTIAAWDNNDGNPLNIDDIPDDVKYWPGRGNPYWAEKFSFDLPDQNLGAFWDQPGGKAGVYDPAEGDFPLINIRDCEPTTRVEAKELVPDQMVFWIYNDAGNNHLETGADKIQMEIQVQAFAYATNDQVNDMTFLRYRLINKAIEDIQDCYFAMWVDPDLGCHLDDYIGCDVDRSMAYVYNEDALDGSVGDACPGGINTYGSKIPILGIDYFRGPRGPKVFRRDENGDPILNADGEFILDNPVPGTGEVDTLVELGMTSFVYTNSGAGGEPPGTTDPRNGEQAYNVLRGLWPDGRPVTFGGTIVGNSGYNDPENQDSVKYVFPGLPNDDNEWSMCSADLPFGDRRTIQATGPILLQAGGLPEELIVGAVFVPDMDYPCPDISRLQFADDIAQALFNNCFDITDGPDAPDMFAVELDRQLILMLSNDTLVTNSNNAKQEYEEVDLQAPETIEDNTYKFEGYKVYQLQNPAVSVQELDDPEKAKLIRQVDVNNGVGKIYNWYPENNPIEANKTIFRSKQEVNGADKGISTTFNILFDAFDEGGGKLVNHKDYYFLVVAYAYNNYQPFNNDDQTGQKRPYLEGRGNVRTYTFTPRPVVYEDLNSAYGQSTEITRLEGVGTGFTKSSAEEAGELPMTLTDGSYDAILDGSSDGVLTYKAGTGPFNVKIIDPLNIKDGKYSLEIVGPYNDKKRNFEEGKARWKLTNITTGNVIYSEVPIEELNEQIIYGEGFSVTLQNPGEPGDLINDNGALGQTFEYADAEGPQWYLGSKPSTGFTLVDGEGNTVGNVLAFEEPDLDFDPNRQLVENGTGFFSPMQVTRWRAEGQQNFISPNWINSYGFAGEQGLKYIDNEDLNNVDIVLTSDKSKWSRCIVVEAATKIYTDNGMTTEGGTSQFDLRKHPSVGKDGNPDGDGEGMGWFPGYAVDIETGERLNIFFAENSAYTDARSIETLGEGDVSLGNGDDLIWNPNNVLFAPQSSVSALYPSYNGGQHFVYVTRSEYDECAQLRDMLSKGNPFTNKINLMAAITYASFPMTNIPLLSVEQGLIPNDATFKVRVTNKFRREVDYPDVKKAKGETTVGGNPLYEFEFTGVEATDKTRDEMDNPLAGVNIVPNPYYAYSSYETSQFDQSIKVVNLPARATVTIYSLDGKFIKRFERDEQPVVNAGNNPARTDNQVYPALEWDMKNDADIPVASGVYIFHISAPTLGAERSIKWFGVNRKFDPTGL